MSGYDEALWMPASIYYPVALGEVILASMIATGQGARLAANAVICLAMAGAIVMLSTDAPCGCLGSTIKISRGLHSMLIGLLGLCAVAFVALGTSHPTPNKPPQLKE
jgi:uncharacterized membrane protein YphA (DoxX/SURF4 family)